MNTSSRLHTRWPQLSTLALMLLGSGPLWAQAGAEPSVTAAAASAPASAPLNIHLRISRQVSPVYPAKARKEGMQGTVKVEVEIDAEGRQGEIKILESPGELLSEAVRQAIQQSRYKPRVKDGQAVATRMRQEFHFYP
ncbi:energy transducer TonB [Paucibacter sp. DJ1R-11]|uniref:energy transducer TonB n=1 Tax=Paucibacter sp. DJ1R-11 TaxID=2893556 RepID=UPI0021E40F92|nr:energy transducer TonB [Paucibacter sp. DJ1R-11]MCV2362709.1 energy transducer TonB [Paucibacter sp. DJ1R-11]